MTRPALAALCVLLLLLSACSPGGDEDEPRPTGDSNGAEADSQARPKAPRTGRCYRLRHRDAVAAVADRPPVPCRRKHTSVTFHVGKLDLRPGRRRLPVDAGRVQRQVAQACPRRLREHLGGSEEAFRLTMLTSVWFTPTVEEAERGARWFRCDVVAPGPEKSLLPLPGPAALAGILDDAGRRDAFATCGTAEPGAQDFRRVTCDRRHSWRAVASVDLGDGRYPGDARTAELMRGPCTEAARERAADPLDFSWAEERPSEEQWRAGRRHGLCWTEARDQAPRGGGD